MEHTAGAGKNRQNRYVLAPSQRFFLDASSPVPLYHQMEQILLKIISSDDAVGKLLPSENELAAIFGVSRITVKKALDILASKGMVERRRALGTRVARLPVTEDLARLTSYTEEMEARGLTVKTRVLATGRHLPDDAVREKLKLEPGQETVFATRLRGTTEQFPVLLVKTELPTDLGITPDEDFSDSLYRIMETRHHISIAGAIETLGAAKATPEQAQLLGIARGDCVLVLEELAYAPDGR
ncbi:MAG: GntR family transcriptional regulator, partial [Armatimonadota bacterium]